MFTIYECNFDGLMYQARVVIDETRATFFQFNHFPTQVEVDTAVVSLLEAESLPLPPPPGGEL